MGVSRAGVVIIPAQQMPSRRSLYEAAEARPGRSDLAYMQHKYSPLDSRIIIITAAILILLIAILFLNFFIRWLLRRIFLLRSPKPISLNKGLSKRQIQALPSFIYSSSKSLPTQIPSPPCRHPIFYPSFISHPLSSQFCHVLFPPSMVSTKVGDTNYQHPIKFEDCKGDHNTPSQLDAVQVHKVTNDQPNKGGSLEGDQLVSTHVNVVDKERPTKFGSLKVDHALGISPTSPAKEELVNKSSCSEAIVHSTDNEVKAIAINDCKNEDKMDKLVDENASLASPCPICLVEFVDGETLRELPTCRHYFHSGCIDLWLAKSSSCPACRASLLDATKAPSKESSLHVQVATTISQ